MTKHIQCDSGQIQAPVLSLVTKPTFLAARKLVIKATSLNCRVYSLDDKAALSHDSFHLQASAKATQAAEALQQQQQASVVAKPGSQLVTSQGTGEKHSVSCCTVVYCNNNSDHAIVDLVLLLSVDDAYTDNIGPAMQQPSHGMWFVQ